MYTTGNWFATHPSPPKVCKNTFPPVSMAVLHVHNLFLVGGPLWAGATTTAGAPAHSGHFGYHPPEMDYAMEYNHADWGKCVFCTLWGTRVCRKRVSHNAHPVFSLLWVTFWDPRTEKYSFFTFFSIFSTFLSTFHCAHPKKSPREGPKQWVHLRKMSLGTPHGPNMGKNMFLATYIIILWWHNVFLECGTQNDHLPTGPTGVP